MKDIVVFGTNPVTGKRIDEPEAEVGSKDVDWCEFIKNAIERSEDVNDKPTPMRTDKENSLSSRHPKAKARPKPTFSPEPQRKPTVEPEKENGKTKQRTQHVVPVPQATPQQTTTDEIPVAQATTLRRPLKEFETMFLEAMGKDIFETAFQMRGH